MEISQKTKAINFKNLHNGLKILILPNAWDVASAKLYEQAGFDAIGTTSAGIAASFGFAEPEKISRAEMLNVVTRIVKAVDLPVTADIEAGYAQTADGVAETVKLIISTGAVGINLEDSPGLSNNTLQSIEMQVDRLSAAHEAALSTGIPLVINARTDVYLFTDESPSNQLNNVIRRANAYLEAGADCVFVPGVVEANIISHLVREIQGPINILANSGVPTISELQKLGVARVSMGSGPMRATLSLVRHIANELLEIGTYTKFTADTIPYSEVNKFFK